MNVLDPVHIRTELDRVEKHWTPRVVGRVNDQYVKVAKLLGEFVWHSHDEQDEMFLVIYGRLRIQLEGRTEVVLEPGDFYVVPKDTQHNPVAEQEVGIVLIETVTTKHTGDVEHERSVPIDEQVAPA